MKLDPQRIRTALSRFHRVTIEQGELRPAAVLVPLFVKEGKGHVLLTRRTDTMNHHRGEIAFPGGVRHVEDADLLATALRETQEEVGIFPADIKVLGHLDDIVSVHGYHVTPFVGIFPYPYPLRINDREIAQVLEIPLSILADPAHCRTEDWRHRGRDLPVWFYTVGEDEIWGLTAAILRQFLQRTVPDSH
jgi:8-oxo-dGTP pyrophosphatase MutT (NUDIX family)